MNRVSTLSLPYSTHVGYRYYRIEYENRKSKIENRKSNTQVSNIEYGIILLNVSNTHLIRLSYYYNHYRSFPFINRHLIIYYVMFNDFFIIITLIMLLPLLTILAAK